MVPGLDWISTRCVGAYFPVDYCRLAFHQCSGIFSKIIIATRTGFLRIINKDIQDLSATADTAYFDCYIQCSPGMLSILAYKWFFESDTAIMSPQSQRS